MLSYIHNSYVPGLTSTIPSPLASGPLLLFFILHIEVGSFAEPISIQFRVCYKKARLPRGGITCVLLPCLPEFYLGAEDLNTVPHACAALIHLLSS